MNRKMYVLLQRKKRKEEKIEYIMLHNTLIVVNNLE